MLCIHLHNLRFKAYHGLYEEEKVLGNDFIVNLDVSYLPATQPAIAEADILNYVEVYELVRAHMAIPTPLLETLATAVAHDILARFSLAETVVITIHKLQPPIAGYDGTVGVSFSVKRNT